MFVCQPKGISCSRALWTCKGVCLSLFFVQLKYSKKINACIYLMNGAKELSLPTTTTYCRDQKRENGVSRILLWWSRKLPCSLITAGWKLRVVCFGLVSKWHIIDINLWTSNGYVASVRSLFFKVDLSKGGHSSSSNFQVSLVNYFLWMAKVYKMLKDPMCCSKLGSGFLIFLFFGLGTSSLRSENILYFFWFILRGFWNLIHGKWE